jgi:hypothetical protein
MPTLVAPRIDASGKAIFPSGLSVPARTRNACQALFDRLAPAAQDDAATQADIASLLRFSRCMRSHGVADWPDPRPDGTFQPDQRIAHSLKTVFRSQFMTCERFNPDPRGRISFSHA